MPRAARLVMPDVPLHVYQRGNNRTRCFVRPADYQWYLHFLSDYAAEFCCTVHAYCLMTNHVHLLLTPSAPKSCALLMKHLSQRYVQRFNKAHSRTGTLWEGRFHSCVVPTDRYVIACYRYIELNPVRAGMVAGPGDYAWSSHAANVGGDTTLVKPHPALGVSGPAYKTLFDEPLPADQLAEIRKATCNGFRLGDRPSGVCPPGNGGCAEGSKEDRGTSLFTGGRMAP
jgi:putative transposase